MKYLDQLNRNVALEHIPKRIVSLVPSQTELLVDLGLENELVGVTKFCVHPSHLRKQKTVVGGTKQIHVNKIKALRPDIILCNKEENTKEIIKDLEDVAPIHISDVDTVEDCLELIKMYGAIFNSSKNASELIEAIKIERQKFQSALQSKKKKKVAYFIWKNPWIVAASNTFINTMINEAGFSNIFENQERYPEIDLEDSKLKEADLIFLSSEPYPFKTKDIDAFKEQFQDKEIIIVDGEMFSWYGSRLLKSYKYFQTSFY
ncbi:cobalamin-binding protein [Winogradskyella sp. J14-2]|uniref:ABC transporter substrate-binding protein n=1 Tax=Winogradskyella sp. J14-2 TaxID=1936080 RepID=UPI000972A3F2|nr:helical backbone metal receptor [Winogradskyella sp. J14-2]APY09126.1 cobalamin-binding protein [Winogradskyella sp. J14-2]